MVRVIETLKRIAPQKKLHLIFGASKGKDVEGMLRLLLPETTTTVMTRSTHPKSMEPVALVQLADHLGYSCQSTLKVEEALENLVKELGNDGVLLCTGSLFIAAAVKDVWKTLKSDVKE